MKPAGMTARSDRATTGTATRLPLTTYDSRTGNEPSNLRNDRIGSGWRRSARGRRLRPRLGREHLSAADIGRAGDPRLSAARHPGTFCDSGIDIVNEVN